MTQLYYAYAEADSRQRDQLEKHLRGLKQKGVLSDWKARAVGRVAGLRGEVSPQADKADVVLLLVSGDFVSSDYCHGPEVRRALERHRRGEARVIPVLLRPCNWKDTPFGGLSALPRDGKPVSRWNDPEAAFQAVAAGIASPIAQQAESPAPETPANGSAPTGGAGAPGSPAAGAAPGAAEPAPDQVALQPHEIGEGFAALDAPGDRERAAKAANKFVSLTGSGTTRVAQLVFLAKSPGDAVARLDAAEQAEAAKGGRSEPVPSEWDPAAKFRQVTISGRATSTVILLAAKGRYLVAARVTSADGAEGEGDTSPADLATSIVRRMLARISA